MIWLWLDGIRTKAKNAVLWFQWIPVYLVCTSINTENPVKKCEENTFETKFLGQTRTEMWSCSPYNCPRIGGKNE